MVCLYAYSRSSSTQFSYKPTYEMFNMRFHYVFCLEDQTRKNKNPLKVVINFMLSSFLVVHGVSIIFSYTEKTREVLTFYMTVHYNLARLGLCRSLSSTQHKLRFLNPWNYLKNSSKFPMFYENSSYFSYASYEIS